MDIELYEEKWKLQLEINTLITKLTSLCIPKEEDKNNILGMMCSHTVVSYAYERLCKWDHFYGMIPFIKFDPDWEVKIIPPYAGAIVRFLIKKDDKAVSIYLDGNNCLGCMPYPYWEIYPYKGDTFRCAIGESENLLEAIRYAFSNWEKEKE